MYTIQKYVCVLGIGGVASRETVSAVQGHLPIS